MTKENILRKLEVPQREDEARVWQNSRWVFIHSVMTEKHADEAFSSTVTMFPYRRRGERGEPGHTSGFGLRPVSISLGGPRGLPCSPLG